MNSFELLSPLTTPSEKLFKRHVKVKLEEEKESHSVFKIKQDEAEHPKERINLFIHLI